MISTNFATSIGIGSRDLSAERSAEKQLQSVFSAVLATAGQPGYASAAPLESSAPIEDSISESWQSWLQQVAQQRYSESPGPQSPSVREDYSLQNLQDDYQKILQRSHREGGYANPTTFLKSLSPEELAVIQQVQHLADPISTDGLSRESALNLLLPPPAQIDLNNDGLTSVGAADTLKFPDSQTPSIVRDAWEQATADMSPADRMTYELMMSRVSLVGTDAANTVPAEATIQSFMEKSNSWLEYLGLFKNQMPVEQYVQGKEFWTTFRNNLWQADA